MPAILNSFLSPVSQVITYRGGWYIGGGGEPRSGRENTWCVVIHLHYGSLVLEIAQKATKLVENHTTRDLNSMSLVKVQALSCALYDVHMHNVGDP